MASIDRPIDFRSTSEGGGGSDLPVEVLIALGGEHSVHTLQGRGLCIGPGSHTGHSQQDQQGCVGHPCWLSQCRPQAGIPGAEQ